MESIQSKLLKTVLRIVRLNRKWKLTGNALRKYIEKKQLSESHEPFMKFKKDFNISKKEVATAKINILLTIKT